MVSSLSRILHCSSLASLTASLFGPQNPYFRHCHEHGQLAFSAHFRKGSTWLCLSTALGAFENMSFNEVRLITRLRGQPSCSLVRLDQNFQSSSTSEGSKKHVRGGLGSHVPLSLIFKYVCTSFIHLESFGITVQYPEYILISGTSLYFFSDHCQYNLGKNIIFAGYQQNQVRLLPSIEVFLIQIWEVECNPSRPSYLVGPKGLSFAILETLKYSFPPRNVTTISLLLLYLKISWLMSFPC